MLDFKLPELGENIESGQVVKISVLKGDTVEKEQTLLELETEKATIDIPSPSSGKINDILVSQGDVITIGQLLVKIDESGEQKPESEEKIPQKTEHSKIQKEPPVVISDQPETKDLEPKTESNQISSSFADVNAAPSIRRLARELGVDLHQVTGTGPEKLILEKDVKSFVKDQLVLKTNASNVKLAEPLPDFSKWGSIKREPMNNIRKITAEHLSHAWATIPHVTQFGNADITALEELRKKQSHDDKKLTITPFIMKVIAASLKQFPKFNASIDTSSQEIIYKDYVNIGVAVDTENGLLVPVIRDVDKKGIFKLAEELKEITERARNKKLGLDDMKGGCFTITNLGSLGAGHFTPIINWPEVAILGICRAELKPCFQEATCAPRLILPLTLSYDHRIIDGADGARFMKWICDAIENPFMLELN